ncbi:MAG: VPLPA-CTERM sorting domain-containing protein [Pseudomonadota bacterium]
MKSLVLNVFAGLSALSMVGAAHAASITLYEEDFTGQEGEGLTGPEPDNTSYTSSNGQWSVTTGSPSRLLVGDHARVEDRNDFYPNAVLPGGEHFQFFDVNEPVTWTTSEIDISGQSNVKVSLDIFEIGDASVFDFVEVSYSVDGGAFQQFFRETDDFSDPDGDGDGERDDPGNLNPLVLEAMADIPMGSTLVLQVVADVTFSDRSIGFDNVLVTSGMPPADPIPLPGALPLMAAGLGVLALRRRRQSA